MQYKWVALSVTSVGMIMSGVDTRIVLVGLPTIARQLGANVEELVWVTQAYLLASTVGLLLIGRVTDVIGRVKIYNVGFLVFTIGSLFCAISFTPAELIISRIVQGAGSAMLVTNSAAILADSAPQKELGTFLGLNQIAFRGGAMAGLTLSGVIIALADWRALFYINIPIGIFGTLWAHFRLKEIYTKDITRKMDWLGFFTFTTSISMILLSITFLTYGFSNAQIGIALIVIGFLLLVAFVRIETRNEAPLLDLRLFKIKEFLGANIAQLGNAIAYSGLILMVSFYFQIALGMSALAAGLSLLPFEVVYAIFGPLSGRLSDKFGSRWPATIGLAVGSAGMFYLAIVSSFDTYSVMVAALALIGAGNGLFVSPNISSIMGSVPSQRRGIAAGFRSTTFNIGLTTSSGIAVLLVTTGLPYAAFSSLLQGLTPQAQAALSIADFIHGFRIAAFVLATVNALTIIPSFLRGPRRLTATEMNLTASSPEN